MSESEERVDEESGSPAEGGGEGAPSEAPSPTSPPENPPADDEEVEQGREKLERVVGN